MERNCRLNIHKDQKVLFLRKESLSKYPCYL
jgi:hypothetical protein